MCSKPLILAALIAAAPAWAADNSDGALTLHHAFTVPAGTSWGSVAINLHAAGWRVGQADGPRATPTQLRAVLAGLQQIEIGARCAGWVDGPTAYPCGFALADLDLAGSVADRYGQIAYDMQRPSEQARAAAERVSPELRASGLLAPVLDAQRHVGITAPLHYAGDRSAAAGGVLRFRFRALPNRLVPSVFDRASGSVVLRGGEPDAVWQTGRPSEQANAKPTGI